MRGEFIEECVEKYSRRLVAYARNFCSDPDTAQDIAADCFFKLCKAENVDEKRAETWLFKTCRNRAIDLIRRGKFAPLALEEISAEIPDSHDETFSDRLDDIEYLKNLILTLPQRQREALTLRYFSDLEYSEIAEVLGISVNAVGVSLARAVKNLKEKALQQ